MDSVTTLLCNLKFELFWFGVHPKQLLHQTLPHLRQQKDVMMVIELCGEVIYYLKHPWNRSLRGPRIRLDTARTRRISIGF